ncbi:MAG: cupredoxin domain-containing protein [Gallionellaceae bacterium]
MKKIFAMLLTGMVVWMAATLPALAGESRQITVTLDDMLKIHPDRITAKAGETVDFVVHNAGKVKHEFVVGAAKELDEHAKEMMNMNGTSMDGMSMSNMPANSSMQKKEEGVELVDVEPGKTEHLLYHFKKPGVLSFACLYPGHREGGMKGVIQVK